MFQIAAHSLTRLPFLAHEKNRHEQDVCNFFYALFSFSYSTVFISLFFFFLFTCPSISADNREMYQADGKTIAGCDFRMDKKNE